MKIDSIEVIPVSVPYKHQEISSVVDRAGITEVIVKMKTNEGHVGWGEAPRIASAEVIIKAIESMIPVLLNQDPWQNQMLESHIYKDEQAATGNSADAKESTESAQSDKKEDDTVVDAYPLSVFAIIIMNE